jgi:hypothetical protein
MYPSLVTLENLGVFQKLSQGPLTAAGLAQQTGADHNLIGEFKCCFDQSMYSLSDLGLTKLLTVRLMRVAVAWGYINETGPQSYAPTAASNVLAHPSFAAGLRYWYLLFSRLVSPIAAPG